METKKTTTKSPGQKPVHTIRNGAIAANIWLRQSQTGYVYYDFSLSRSWKAATGNREGYSQNFFARNNDDLVDVIQQASDWINDKMENAETVCLAA